MATQGQSTTALVAVYDELVLMGAAPPPEEFCAAYDDHPTLLSRIRELTRLRESLVSCLRVERAPVEPPAIPGFIVRGLLGAGGMGAVFLATQERPQRLCALKVLRNLGAVALARFRREADTMARLSHPSIARIYAAGIQGDCAYLATEYIHGFSLKALLRVADVAPQEDPAAFLAATLRHLVEGSEPIAASAAPAPTGTVLAIAREVAQALGHAHARGVVHRDVKPSNIMITLDGHAKLIDFGLALALDDHGEAVTREGDFVGTYDYAAPEQLRGEVSELGPWTDTYALGATLFEMLTQQLPFPCASLSERIALSARPPPLSPRHHNRRVPRSLDTLVMRALEPTQASRFEDGDAMARTLGLCDGGSGIFHSMVRATTGRLPARMPTGLVAIAIAGCGVLMALYLYERARRVELESSDVTRDQIVLSRALMDARDQLNDCMELGGYQLSSGSPLLAVRLHVAHERVISVEVVSAQEFVGVVASRCMEASLGELRLPGVGLSEPTILPVTIALPSVKKAKSSQK